MFEDSALTTAYSDLQGEPFNGHFTIGGNKIEYGPANPNDLNLVTMVMIAGPVTQTLTLYTQESDFMISAIPAGFAALAGTDFSIVPHNLGVSLA